MKREIVIIDEEKCTGCGVCIPNCHEGALQVIDGKVRLISDLYCDGLGACIEHCPEDAMKIEIRDVEAYDERKVMIDNIIPAGINTIKAHLSHLLDHGAMEFYDEAVKVLEEYNIENPVKDRDETPLDFSGCPGSKERVIIKEEDKIEKERGGDTKSELRQWPVQLHLVSPNAPFFKDSDLLVAADCSSFTLGGEFHSKYLRHKSLAIACPKLDEGLDDYVEKLSIIIEKSNINTVTCMIMEVPCCRGLLEIVKRAIDKSSRKVPLKKVVVGLQGEILEEIWL